MTWPAPDPTNDVPCPFFRCWIGPCGETDRSRCQHVSPYRPDRCSCGRPALSECSMASSLVCGEYICHTGFCARHGGICP